MEKYFTKKRVKIYEKIAFIAYALFLVCACACIILEKKMNFDFIQKILLNVDNIFLEIFGIIFFGFSIEHRDKNVSSLAKIGVIAGFAMIVVGRIPIIGSQAGYAFDILLIVFYVLNKKAKGKSNDYKTIIYDIFLVVMAAIGMIVSHIFGVVIIVVSLVIFFALKMLIVEDVDNKIVIYCPQCGGTDVMQKREQYLGSYKLDTKTKSFKRTLVSGEEATVAIVTDTYYKDYLYICQCMNCKHVFERQGIKEEVEQREIEGFM